SQQHVHRVLHSFPTRRSSDLESAAGRKREVVFSLESSPELPLPATLFNRRNLTGSWQPSVNQVCGISANHRWRRCYFRTMDSERSEEHTSELQSQSNLVCRLL